MDDYKLVFLARDVRDVHIMGRRTKIFEFLAGEDVNCNKMNLGVAVLAGLGRAHLDNLARAAFDDDEPVLAERRALHWIRSGSTGIGALKGVLMLLGKTISTNWREKLYGLIAPEWRGKVC